MDSSPPTPPGPQQFCLRWHNHQASLLSSLPLLLDQSHLTDVTLSAEGKQVRAHRVVLSACSNFFSDLFKSLDAPVHPVIVLPGTSFPAVIALLTFMYSGEVNVFEEQISSLLSLADTLGIKGLSEFNGNHNKPSTPNTETSSTKDSEAPPSPVPSSKLVSPIEPLFSRPFNFNPHLFPQPLNFSFNKPNSLMPRFTNGTGTKTPRDSPWKSVSETENLNENRKSSNLEHKKKKIDKIAENLRTGVGAMSKSFIDGLSMPMLPLPINNSTPFVPHNFMVNESMHKSHEGQLNDAANANLPRNDQPTNPMEMQDVKPVMPIKQPTSKLYATCFICNKQLSNQYNLRVHLETHQNVRYACTVCSHVSRSKDALRKHVSYRHPGTPSPCDPEAKRKRSKVHYHPIIKPERIDEHVAAAANQLYANLAASNQASLLGGPPSQAQVVQQQVTNANQNQNMSQQLVQTMNQNMNQNLNQNLGQTLNQNLNLNTSPKPSIISPIKLEPNLNSNVNDNNNNNSNQNDNSNLYNNNNSQSATENSKF